MLEVAQTLKGRLADMDNPDMWDDRPLDEYLEDLDLATERILRGESWKNV